MLLRQALRYGVVGVLGTLAHLGVLTLGVERLGLGALPASTAGFVCALVLSYLLNRHWTFASRSASFWRYAVVSCLGLALNTGIMYVLAYRLHWWYLAAQLVVIAVVPASNFLLNRHWAFSPAGDSDAPRDPVPVQDLLCALALAVLAVALHAHLPSAFWRGDDPALVLHALQSRPWAAFSDPATWQRLSPVNLTPWLTLSFQADLALGGIQPRVFYLHQLGALAALVVAVFALARQWLPRGWAAAAVLLLLAGAPTRAVVEQLMTRHYLEGMVWAVLALLAFAQATRRGSLGWSLAGACAYAAACTAKEVYVPVVLLVLVLPAGTARERLRLAVPWLLAAAFYVLWRRHMLGGALGGYAEQSALVSLQTVEAAGQFFARLPRLLLGAAWPLPTLLGLLALGLWLRRTPRLLAFALAVGVVALGPLLPLLRAPGITSPDRYLFLPWLVLSLALATALHALAQPARGQWRPRVAAAAVLLLAAGTAAQTSWHEAQRLAPVFREFETQGRFLWQAGPASAYLPSPGLASGYWYATGLCEIKAAVGGACPQALVKGWPLPRPLERILAYDSLAGAMLPQAGDPLALLAVDERRPLSADISLKDGWVRWRLGPADAGRFFFASPQLGRYPVPPTGSVKQVARDLEFQVQLDTPDGRTTASPVLRLREGGSATFTR